MHDKLAAVGHHWGCQFPLFRVEGHLGAGFFGFIYFILLCGFTVRVFKETSFDGHLQFLVSGFWLINIVVRPTYSTAK